MQTLVKFFLDYPGANVMWIHGPGKTHYNEPNLNPLGYDFGPSLTKYLISFTNLSLCSGVTCTVQCTLFCTTALCIFVKACYRLKANASFFYTCQSVSRFNNYTNLILSSSRIYIYHTIRQANYQSNIFVLES